MKPVVALVGRPNVGKSTLFNRLTQRRDAIVADFAGLTRDRHYGNARLGRRSFIVIDTGGFEPDKPTGIVREMARGQVIGEMALVDDGPRSALARALEPSEVLQVPFEPVRKLLNDDPRLLWNVA